VKRVLLTGAASGIGEATREALERQGARVAGLDLTEGKDLIQCDVSDQASVDRAVAEAVERLGGLDVVVNCAGIGIPQSAGKRPDEGAHKVIEVNLMGTWRVTAAALDALLESRGRVVNVASGLAFVTTPFATAYSMSKRGVTAYSDSLRLEYGDRLTVTTVYPGYIKTPIHDAGADEGISLDGAVPEEKLRDAVDTMVRAVLGPPARDLATTRRGAVSYALVRRTPRRLFDRLTELQLKVLAKRGHFDDSEMAREMTERLKRA
jgi:NAD(P)-dependent dehydrogenase (short-subunit alcohol dehydrogenase family)